MSSVHDTRNDDNSDGYASPDPDSRRKGGNDFNDRHSRHKHNSRGSEQDRLRTREHYRHREKDQERHHWEYKDRSAGRGRGRVSYDDYDRHMGRGYDRGGNFSQDKEGRSRHRRRSRSRDRFGDQPRSNLQSHSPSKNKRASGFDMPPPGADVMPNAAVPAEQAGVPQAIPGMLQNMLLFGSTQLGVQTMTQQATRHARRVYVGGLPPLANEQTIASFFSHIMAAIGGNSSGPGDAVVNVYINHEKKFAFVEMRTVAEASNAMALDGIVFEGVSVRVRRPTDYNPALAAALGPSQPSPHLNLAALGLTPGANGGAEGPGRIFVGGLPYFFSESQIRELLESFGPLSGFDLVKDRDTGNSKGYAFCAYQDPAVTDEACRALNGVKMGDKILTVRRATANGQVKSDQETILSQAQQHIAMQMALQTGGLHLPGVGMVPSVALDTPTKILCLSEVITAHELGDDKEYEEILEDMKEEGAKFGALVDVVIPRPNPNGEQNPGVGKVFLEYSDVAGCANARSALSGRKFGGNTVSTIYYPEDKYHNKDYSV